jgi:hypothetical protein
VLGVVLGRPSVQPFKKAGDDDASIYVVLAPSPVNLNPRLQLADTVADDPPEVYWGNPVQGAIVTPQNAVLALGRGYVSDADHVHYLKSIHSEFEGSGMDDLLKWAVAILAILIAAMILTAIPGLGWLGLLLKILAALITLIAGYLGLIHPLAPGDPNDVDPNIGELARGDVVVIKGNWVYDSLHDGWNEIHAIHACQKIGRFDPDHPTQWPALFNGMPINTPDAVRAARDFWCDAIGKAEEAEDGGSRDDPAQNWVVHPLVDGCSIPIIL